LVLDDDFDIINLIKHGLLKYGFDVFAFTDPHLALQHFRINAANYHLIISDIRMPGMNGFEFARKVKEIRPDIKVFLMTAFKISNVPSSGFSQSSVKIECLIQKPISIQMLNMIIEKHVHGLKTYPLSESHYS
jgi:two-component system cell cycle sensor histidine kinase/response regulator CckA